MKKIFLLAFILQNLSLTAQISQPEKTAASIQVGKIAPMGAFIAQLNYSIIENDTTYTLMFNNMKYKIVDEIEIVRFSGIDNTAGELYKVFKSAFLDENKNNNQYAVSFKLGDEMVSISSLKTMGVYQAMFLTTAGYFSLRESQIDKLFGK